MIVISEQNDTSNWLYQLKLTMKQLLKKWQMTMVLIQGMTRCQLVLLFIMRYYSDNHES